VDDAPFFGLLSEHVLLLAMATLRLTVAFLVTPLFSDELVPALVRNSIFIALASVVAFMQPAIDFDSITAAQLMGLFAKEAFIGLTIGFFYSLFLWAFEAAGTIIDTQIGTSLAMVYDPISGHDVTLYGELIGRWANYLFISSGGLLLLTIAIIESYAIWPIEQPLPPLDLTTLVLFEDQFSRFVSLILTLSAPVIAVIFLVDMSMGLINRFAKRLDILFISMAIKGLVALLLIFILIPVLVEVFFLQLDSHRDGLSEFLRAILGDA